VIKLSAMVILGANSNPMTNAVATRVSRRMRTGEKLAPAVRQLQSSSGGRGDYRRERDQHAADGENGYVSAQRP
jgi:hypothetical protein